MSRIGNKPIDIPPGVKTELSGNIIKVTGPLGTLQMSGYPQIKIKIDESGKKIIVENENLQSRQNKQMHGTIRALLANMILGVSKGFEQKIEIYGTGYSVKEQGKSLMAFVESYRKLTRIPKPDLKPFKVSELFSRVRILADSLDKGDDTEISFQLNDPDLEIFADENLISLVLINLIKNAVEANENNTDCKIEVLSGLDLTINRRSV